MKAKQMERVGACGGGMSLIDTRIFCLDVQLSARRRMAIGDGATKKKKKKEVEVEPTLRRA